MLCVIMLASLADLHFTFVFDAGLGAMGPHDVTRIIICSCHGQDAGDLSPTGIALHELPTPHRDCAEGDVRLHLFPQSAHSHYGVANSCRSSCVGHT